MKYRNEEDKCYGIAGMVIGISIWNGEDLLYKIDLDDEQSGYLTFTPDYYFQGNPAVSPVEAWHHTLKRYQMTVGMSIANMMCRTLKSGSLDYAKAKKVVFKTVADEGKRACQLEDDEIRKIFQETYTYLEQAFRNDSIRVIARRFAERLQADRRLDNYAVKELLGMLQEI